MQLINQIADVPAAIGPYSQAVAANGFLFCSGQIPINPASAKIEATDVAGQTAQVLSNIKALLASQGLGVERVVKTTIFLTSMADFPVVNPIYADFFGEHKPARSTVQVAGLPLGSLVEIEVTAQLSGE